MIAIFDTETTGLVKNSSVKLVDQPYMIEFAGVLLADDDTISEELTFICNPRIKIEPIITKITGLKQEDLDKHPAFGTEQADKLQGFFGKAQLAVAHNFTFDKAIVSFSFQRLERQLTWPEKVLCTVEATEHLKGRRLKLHELHSLLLGREFEGAHRAMADVKALTDVVKEMRKKELL